MEYWKIQLTAGVVGIVFALIAWRITSSATGALTPGGGPVATGGVAGAAFEGSDGGAGAVPLLSGQGQGARSRRHAGHRENVPAAGGRASPHDTARRGRRRA